MWPAHGHPAAFDEMRQHLQDQLGNPARFRRRARTRAEWSVLGLIIGAPIVLFQLAVWGWRLATSDDGVDQVWRSFRDSSSLIWFAAGLGLVALSQVSVVMRDRREHRLLRSGGWVGFQAPTGWVNLETEGASVVQVDRRSVAGSSEERRRVTHPIVLVSGPDMDATQFAAALASVRSAISAGGVRAGAMEEFNRERKLPRAVPARWFDDAAGCLLGQGDHHPFTAAIPRPMRRGRRTRLASIPLTSAEQTQLSR